MTIISVAKKVTKSGVIKLGQRSSLDINALKFINAASISDNSQKNALNKFIKSLKSINQLQAGFIDFNNPSNSIIQALYPIIGGNATSHKFNLVNPIDSDAAFRLIFSGTITHDSNGIKSDGTTGYADTKLSPRSILNDSNHGIDLFINSGEYSSTLSTEIGAGAAVSDRFAIINNYGSTNLLRIYDKGIDENRANTNESNIIGVNILNREQDGVGFTKYYRNGRIIIENSTDPAGTLPIENLYISRFSGLASYFSKRTLSFVSIRKSSINDAARTAFEAAIIQLQIDLNRCPDKNIAFEGHSMMAGTGASTTRGMLINQVVQGINEVSFANRIFNSIPAAIAGSKTTDIISRYETDVNTYFRANLHFKNILIIWIGINDLKSTGIGPTAAWANTKSYIENAMSDGWNIISLTASYAIASWDRPDAYVDSFNNLMKSDAPNGCIVIDVLQHVELQDPSNSTYFDDGIHYTDLGYAIVANDIITQLNLM